MTFDLHTVRRCSQSAINPFHSSVYFSPDLAKEFAALGITDPLVVTLVTRAAAMGTVGAGVVSAAFLGYRHDLVARHLPAVWETATPEEVLAARLRAADSTLRRLLGPETVDSPELAEAAELALRATEGCTRAARTLCSAHADLPVPGEPHLRLWHATTLLREHRGDGHVAALLLAGLDPLEAMAAHTASGQGLTPKWVRTTRGWEQEDLDAAVGRLRERGLLDAAGDLTEEGKDLREQVESDTDRLDSAPYRHLGADGVARLTEIVGGFVAKAAQAGAFPADLIGRG
ncbi:hypothetical protein [Streptomyces sp. NPDC051567]|uniref:SCO6745 family protein n=1 Tax=Streptomyces sp. NPDC051567 TaxID=3365660 RepID=UPI00379DA5AD